MKRPAFQFYPEKWVGNQKLRRCSKAARGTWIDTLCALHDSDEYGVVRYPLRELADVVHTPIKLLRELVDKGVLKGSDKAHQAHVFTPTHAGKPGRPVTLIKPGDGPCWYSSRMVEDEYIRSIRGSGTRFETNQSPHQSPPLVEHQSLEPKPPIGDGASSSALYKPNVGESPTVPSPGTPNHGAISPSKGKNGEWWKTPSGIEAEAKTLGLNPLRGESHAQLKARCFEEIGARRR